MPSASSVPISLAPAAHDAARFAGMAGHLVGQSSGQMMVDEVIDEQMRLEELHGVNAQPEDEPMDPSGSATCYSISTPQTTLPSVAAAWNGNRP